MLTVNESGDDMKKLLFMVSVRLLGNYIIMYSCDINSNSRCRLQSISILSLYCTCSIQIHAYVLHIVPEPPPDGKKL